MEDTTVDQVDSTLPPEWTLPELPKNITPSLTTAEFEEIFGGSDEESNFPLSVGGLQGHLELETVLPNPNELFSATIPESLNLESKTSSTGRTEVETSTIEKQPVEEITVTDTVNEDPKPVTEEEKMADVCKVDNELTDQPIKTELTEDDNMIVDVVGTDKDVPSSVAGRRSARLRAREDNVLVSDVEVTVKSEKGENSEFDEESLVDSLLEKNSEVFQQKDSSDEPSQSDINLDSNVDDEDVGSGDEDSDDPDKLWCICQQPHNDRFMICCDSCGEWYHGDCVGISVTEGKRMEKTGQEYVCTKCVDRENEIKTEREKNRSMRLAKREQIREKHIAGIREKILSDTDTDTKNGDLFLPDNIPEKDRVDFKNKKKKLRIRDLVKKPCLGPGCEKMAVRPCLYCSEECIEKHCEFSLKKLSVRGLLPSKGQGITLYEPSTKKMLTGHSAPDQKTLLQFLKGHKSFKVFVPSQKVLPAAKKPVKKFRRESDKDDQVPDSSSSIRPLLDATAIRGHARKALKQVLTLRCQGMSDIMKSDTDITELANDIELKLYNLYNQDVSQKYRSKCRSLLFNLKDTKNQVLFKKLVTGILTTRQLVRMSPDQLASEELAEWREKTIKKELDMIKEVAIEEAQMSSTGTIRKMTYKGEVEIERQSEIETTTNDKADEVTSTTPEVPPGSDAPPTTTPTIKPKLEIKSTSDSKISSLLTDILTNTTSQHESHVFDQSCDICLGKKIPKLSPIVAKATITPDPDLPSPDSRTMDTELINTVITSPDTVETFSDPIPDPPTPNYPIWTGTVSMHGLETTTVVAYPVSGPVEKIDIQNTFPDSLLVIGRIAHVQVWDYIDKLKSSLTKEIVVLRFDRIEDDCTTYLDCMDYFLQKHRYGVVQCTSISGIKDMYIVPLQYDDPPPPQLFPFDGPGLPINRKDTFLCIMTRMKFQQPITPEIHVPRKRKHSGKVQFSVDTLPSDIPRKKPRKQVIVGFGDQTPPYSNEPEQSVSPQIHEEVEDVDVKHKPFFYREMEIKETIIKQEHKMDTTSPATGIKSILSTLSDEKIKELASVAMSAFGTTDIKTEITPSSESTSLMKGTMPQYSISTAQLNDQSRDPRSHNLSLDERLKATFGNTNSNKSKKPTGTIDTKPGTNPDTYTGSMSGYPHSHSAYPQSDQNYKTPFQQRQIPVDHTQRESRYQPYYSSADRGYDSSSYRPPLDQSYPPDRYSDYRPSGGFGSVDRYDYDYDRGNDHYRQHRGSNRGDMRGYGNRGGPHWDGYRERDNRTGRDERDLRNDDYGR